MATPKLGWVIYNGHLGGKKFLDFAEWIQRAAHANGMEMKIIKNNALLAIVGTDSSILIKEKELPDFVVFSDKDIPLAQQLEAMGVPLFNSSKSIAVCDNKILMYQALSEAGIRIPKTIIAPKIFPGTLPIQLETFAPAISELGFPVIIKEAFGSFGEQVYLVHNKAQLHQKITEIGTEPFVLQEYIQSSHGRDIRINVVGGKVVASMIRTSETDFRANVSRGGSMQQYTPNAKEAQLAIAAAAAVGTDFAGVDLLFGPEGEPLVCEVNSNAHIRSIYDCTGVDVSVPIISYIKEVLS
ncbi:ribosomal protein S6--L-glutamate ligase/gamma-F420-2:alpha-L-glutamate ligase [Terribacillus halophilus]|uniref:Ribosomal protein S6--L-glutamate ligase/gamma-F420-2:alpha-L-glutamate ligase n=1 Tax=Terribacillus halophilus TaxID=361279 RepID=A0A1G6SGT7_9BACI|nr:RimK family alpha-L-glutamate ligase [Terribacillus halophilus]SDD15376.1 ribosomal protein S6--L-glutamate ligase/gamma-F420-2:alpha-L-glutamate ligase [Terribacillus halophilus]